MFWARSGWKCDLWVDDRYWDRYCWVAEEGFERDGLVYSVARKWDEQGRLDDFMVGSSVNGLNLLGNFSWMRMGGISENGKIMKSWGLKKGRRSISVILPILLLQLMMRIPLGHGLDETMNSMTKQEAYYNRRLINPVESGSAVKNVQGDDESRKIKPLLQDEESLSVDVNEGKSVSSCKNAAHLHTLGGSDVEEELSACKFAAKSAYISHDDSERNKDLEKTSNEEAERPKPQQWDDNEREKAQVDLDMQEDSEEVRRFKIQLEQLHEVVRKIALISGNQSDSLSMKIDSPSSLQDDREMGASETELRDLRPEVSQENDFDQDQTQTLPENGALNDTEKLLPVLDSPYLLGPRITDWDDQRKTFLDANPHLKTTSGGKPRVLMISGSDPNPCLSPIGDTFYIKSLKLKMDYARIHDYEIFYNFAHLDPLFNGYWAKYPLIRNLMLSHAEIEWFFWVDGDVVFTDVLFEAPLETYDGVNWVMQGYNENLFRDRSWVAVNAGVFLVRNCQWTLDLFDKWSPYGPDGPLRPQIGKLLTEFFSDRPEGFHADDQSVLGYLIVTDETVRERIKLVGNEYIMSGYWKFMQDVYEASEKSYHPGLGDWRWPWTMHFVGCSLCMRGAEHPDMKECLEAFERAYRFADKQVQRLWGLQYESPSTDFLIPVRNETDRPLEALEENPWAERIAKVQAASARYMFNSL